MVEVSSTAGPSKGGEAAFEVGSWERPDAGGVVPRGGGRGFPRLRGGVRSAPLCWVGKGVDGIRCERPAAMQVYGLSMREVHGEGAASGALAEIAHDLERELQRPMNPEVGGLSPHLKRALWHGFGSLPAEAYDHKREHAALLAAFPFDPGLTDGETLAYVEEPDDREPPRDYFMGHRLLLCRFMRLAFEEEADWLVEMLEAERKSVAAQAAYALALEREADG